MNQTDCKHYGTMTLTPCEDKGWEVLEWCFSKEESINEGCPKDCPYKNKPVIEYESE